MNGKFIYIEEDDSNIYQGKLMTSRVIGNLEELVEQFGEKIASCNAAISKLLSNKEFMEAIKASGKLIPVDEITNEDVRNFYKNNFFNVISDPHIHVSRLGPLSDKDYRNSYVHLVARPESTLLQEVSLEALKIFSQEFYDKVMKERKRLKDLNNKRLKAKKRISEKTRLKRIEKAKKLLAELESNIEGSEPK